MKHLLLLLALLPGVAWAQGGYNPVEQQHVIVDSGTVTATISGTVPVSGSVSITGTPAVTVSGTVSTTRPSVTSSKSSAVEANHVFKASAGSLVRWRVTSGAVDGYTLVFDATSAPADGAVTPAFCQITPKNSTVEVDWTSAPVTFSTGITASFSTTGCFTKTASSTVFFSWVVQ